MFANRPACSPRIRLVKAVLVAMTPPLAYAAEQTMLRASPLEEISILTWVAIIVFATIGWIVYDVDRVADLWNEEHDTRYKRIVARLKLFKSIIGSQAAGVFTYFGGKVAPGMFVTLMGLKTDGGHPPEIHEFLLLILVAGAGWLGSRWFERAFGARQP